MMYLIRGVLLILFLTGTPALAEGSCGQVFVKAEKLMTLKQARHPYSFSPQTSLEFDMYVDLQSRPIYHTDKYKKMIIEDFRDEWHRVCRSGIYNS